MADKVSTEIDVKAMLRVLDVSRRLAVPCELVELLELIIDVGREVLTADRGTVFLYDAENRELYSTVATGVKQFRFSVDAGIAGECARTRQSINVPDCYADERFNRDIDKKTGYKTRCSLTVPLIGLDEELVGVTQLLNPSKPHFEEADERIAEALASQAAVAIQRARLIEDRIVKLRMQQDLALARKIQQDVLPKVLPKCEGYDLASFSRPADETGGDIYDVIPLAQDQAGGEFGLVILLADATGHGVGPALSVIQSRAMLRMGLKFSRDLDALVHGINAQLTEDLASNRFITAFFGVLDSSRHRIVYHAPGQGPLLHFTAADRQCHWFPASTLPMGIFDEPDLDRPDAISMAPGDVFVLLTDGFYEYQNAAGDQFGNEGVGTSIAAHADRPAAQILEALLEATLTFADGAPQDDDLTAIIIRRES